MSYSNTFYLQHMNSTGSYCQESSVEEASKLTHYVCTQFHHVWVAQMDPEYVDGYHNITCPQTDLVKNLNLHFHQLFIR